MRARPASTVPRRGRRPQRWRSVEAQPRRRRGNAPGGRPGSTRRPPGLPAQEWRPAPGRRREARGRATPRFRARRTGDARGPSARIPPGPRAGAAPPRPPAIGPGPGSRRRPRDGAARRDPARRGAKDDRDGERRRPSPAPDLPNPNPAGASVTSPTSTTLRALGPRASGGRRARSRGGPVRGSRRAAGRSRHERTGSRAGAAHPRGEFACTVESAPSWPVLSAGQEIESLGPRTSPITIRSGRIRSAFRKRSRIVTSPLPSTLGGRLSSRTTCGWRRRSSAASSIVTTRSAAADEAWTGR